MLNDLKELIAIPSVLGAPAPGAPFGKDVRRALDLFLERAARYGLKTGELDGYCGWAEYGDGAEMIGILCHIDVVPAGDGWTGDPFTATVEDGKVYGRGAADDKGPLAACLHVMKRLTDEQIALRRRVRLIVGCNEENGSACMKHYHAHGELPLCNLVPDADFPVINSEKGILHLTISLPADDFFMDNIVALSGGVRPNVIPDEARLIVRPGSPLHRVMLRAADPLTADVFARAPFGERLVSEGIAPADFSLIHDAEGVTVIARGVAGHAMDPESGDNAIAKLFVLLQSVADELPSPLIDQAERYLCGRLAAARSGLYVDDARSGDLTMNVGLADFDGKTLTLTVDFRLPLGVTPDRVCTVLKGVLPAGTKFLTSYSPNLYLDPTDPLIETLLGVYEAVTGEKGTCEHTGGGTYARELPRSVAFGPTFPGRLTNIHNADECIPVADLERLAEIYYRAILALDRTKI